MLREEAMRRLTAAIGFGKPDDPCGAVATAPAAVGVSAASRPYWGACVGAALKSAIGPCGSGAAAGAFLETDWGSGPRVPNLARQL